MKFYVYVHKRADTLEPFYVGKGTRRRAWNCSSRSSYWKRIKEKHGHIVEILYSDLEEQHAFDLEILTIQEYRADGFTLCNLTDGGEGASGQVKTAETKLKHSKAMRGRKLSVEHRLKISKNSKDRSPKLIERNSDFNTYTFVSLLGEVFTGTREDFCKSKEIKPYNLRVLFLKGKPAKTCNGWALCKGSENPEDTLKRVLEKKPRKVTKRTKPVTSKVCCVFVNLNGTSFKGTRECFEKEFKVKTSPLFSETKIIHICEGWCLAIMGETTTETINRVKIDKSNRSACQKVYKFVHKDGQYFTGTRLELCLRYALDANRISQLFGKKQRPTVLGWGLERGET